MSHHSIKSSYKKLEERLNRFPQGVPPSKTLYQILEMLFSEQEASLVAQLPIKAFNTKMASKIWKTSELEAKKILDQLASRALLLDIEHNGEQQYVLPPPMAGFFEFSLMRLRNDIDQKALSELFYQYLNVEEDFIKDLFLGTETRLGRVFVQESVLTNDEAVHILDYERASHVIAESSHIGLGMCYCRHKMQHVGLACDAPMDVCLTFNNAAASLIKHGHARLIDRAEAMDVLNLSYENNLVQCGENVRKQVSFICNCCGCCCEGLVAVRKFGALQPLHTTSYIPEINYHNCTGCGKCAKVCPIEAIHMVPAATANIISGSESDVGTIQETAATIAGGLTEESEDFNRNQSISLDAISESVLKHNTKRLPQIDKDICLGCGVCVRGCNQKSITLKRRKQKIITPANSVHRAVLMAIEKGMLHELIFDNQAFTNHRAMASILAVILKLPPIKQGLASNQLKSVYLDKLLERK